MGKIESLAKFKRNREGIVRRGSSSEDGTTSLPESAGEEKMDKQGTHECPFSASVL